MYTEGGRPAVEAGTGMGLGMLVEQVQEVELFGGEWRDGLLFLCMSSPSAGLPLYKCGGGAVIDDLKSEVASKTAGGQQHLNGTYVIQLLNLLKSLMLQ